MATRFNLGDGLLALLPTSTQEDPAKGDPPKKDPKGVFKRMPSYLGPYQQTAFQIRKLRDMMMSENEKVRQRYMELPRQDEYNLGLLQKRLDEAKPYTMTPEAAGERKEPYQARSPVSENNPAVAEFVRKVAPLQKDVKGANQLGVFRVAEVPMMDIARIAHPDAAMIDRILSHPDFDPVARQLYLTGRSRVANNPALNLEAYQARTSDLGRYDPRTKSYAFNPGHMSQAVTRLRFPDSDPEHLNDIGYGAVHENVHEMNRLLGLPFLSNDSRERTPVLSEPDSKGKFFYDNPKRATEDELAAWLRQSIAQYNNRMYQDADFIQAALKNKWPKDAHPLTWDGGDDIDTRVGRFLELVNNPETRLQKGNEGRENPISPGRGGRALEFLNTDAGRRFLRSFFTKIVQSGMPQRGGGGNGFA